jgi:tRNA(Ile)-lysidine synthase
VERNQSAQLARSRSRLSLSLRIKLQVSLAREQLLPVGAKVLIAVSGGQDSLCLGQLLVDLQDRWQWQLAIGHCDHGWSADEGIADRVREVAQTWQLPYYCWNAQNLAETEANARHWRYAALVAMAATRGYQYVVTGHTQSDVAETLLYNLVRGAGGEGLSSLRAVRYLTPAVALVRPLLEIDRQTTAEFCMVRQLPVWQDYYNDQPRYARNRMRSWLGQLQLQFHPQVTAHLAQTAQILAAESDYLQELALATYQIAYFCPNRLDRQALSGLPLALQRRVVRIFLQNHGLATSFVAIEQVTDLISAARGSRSSSVRGTEGSCTIVVIEKYLQIELST